MKADKIKLALEKLKEAKVKKVRRRRHDGQGLTQTTRWDKHSTHKNTHEAKGADVPMQTGRNNIRRETEPSIMVSSVSLA